MAMNKDIYSYLRNTEHRVLRTSLFEKGDIIQFPKELFLRQECSINADCPLIMMGVDINGFTRFIPHHTFSKFVKFDNAYYRNQGTFGDYTHKFMGSELDFLESLKGRTIKVVEKCSINVAPVESGDVVLKHFYIMDFID